MADPSSPAPQPIPRVIDEGWLVGKLLAHGQAHYHHDPNASMSYFMRLQTLESERGALRSNNHANQQGRPVDGREDRLAPSVQAGGTREIWSWDLKRAIRDSKSSVAIGMVVAAKIIAREPIDPATFPKDAKSDSKDIAYRNRWEVETPQFIQRRNRFAHEVNENYQQARRDGVEGGEALGLYLIHAGAQAVAAERYANPEDREAFLARVKQVIEASPDREKLIAQAVQRLKQQKSLGPPESKATPSSANHGRQENSRTRE